MVLGLFSCSPSSHLLSPLHKLSVFVASPLPTSSPAEAPAPTCGPPLAGEETLAIFKRLSQEPMLALRFWNATDLNMSLKIKSLRTTYWVPVGAFACIIHGAGLTIGPRRAVFSAPQMPTVFTEQATMRKAIYASKGPTTGSPKTQGPLELTSSHMALM